MPIPSQPPRLENVIGTQADVFTIPETTPEGTAALSYQSGWPAKSATALSAGGVPPQREYFNAVNKMLSQHVFFQQSGSLYQWNNQNNYLQGAHILGSNGKEYVARQQSGPDTSAGVQDPVQDTNGTYWTSAGSSVAAGGGGLETDENGQLYVAKLKTPRSLDGVNFDGSAPVTRFAQCSTAAGTAAKTVTISNFTLVEGATIMVLFNNTNTASNPTLNVSNTGAHPIQWRKAGVSPSWLAANRLYALTYTGSAWQIQGDLTEACIQDGGGLSVDEDGKLFVDFDSMPTDKFEAMLKSIRVPIWLAANKAFYVNQATGSDILDTDRGESASKPFKTIQAAVNYVCENYNISSHTLTIYIEPPYDDLSDLELPFYSASTGAIRIVSKSADPSQCKIRRVSLSFAVPYYLWNITARAYTISTGRYGCFHATKGQLNLQNCVADMTSVNISGGAFSACFAETYGEIRIWALSGSQTDYFNVPGIKIIGNNEHSFDCIFNADSGGLISFAADITIEGSCNITSAFSAASNLSMILWSYSSLAIPGRAPVITISGDSSVSGKRYSSSGNSIVTARSQGTEAYPGTIVGTTTNGGQYY